MRFKSLKKESLLYTVCRLNSEIGFRWQAIEFYFFYNPTSRNDPIMLQHCVPMFEKYRIGHSGFSLLLREEGSLLADSLPISVGV